MDKLAERLKAYIESHPIDLGTLPLEDNNTVFNLCCRLCSAYEHKAFLDGIQYGVHILAELK